MHNLRAPRREAASLAPRMSIVYRTIDQLKPDGRTRGVTARSDLPSPIRAEVLHP
jgi:hypothetical protein